MWYRHTVLQTCNTNPRPVTHASTHVQTHTHPDPIFTTNAEHLDCNFLEEHAPPCCFLTHIIIMLRGQIIDPLAPGSGSAPGYCTTTNVYSDQGTACSLFANDDVLKNCLLKMWGPPGVRGPGARAPMAPLLIRHWWYRTCMQSFIISHSSCAEQYGNMTLNIVIKCNWVTGSPPKFDTLLAVWYRTYMQSFIISHSSCA